MPNRTSPTGSELFIVDNSDTDWKVQRYLHDWCQISKAIDIATGYFEIGSLLSLEDEWQKVAALGPTPIVIVNCRGGSNGYRVRLWKIELQSFATETGSELQRAIFLPGRANGIKLSIDCFRISA